MRASLGIQTRGGSMVVSLSINTANGWKSVPLYNTVTMDERFDEELDGGACETYLETEEGFPEFSEAILTATDGEKTITVPFFLFDDVEKRARGYHRHSLELVEPTRWLMGLLIDGLKVTQPIDGSKKKTLLEVINRVFRCFNAHRYEDVLSPYTGEIRSPIFELDEETEKLLSGVDSPEFEWQGETLLFEVLQDIADVVDSIPRLTVNLGNQFVKIKFDQVNVSTGEYEI